MGTDEGKRLDRIEGKMDDMLELRGELKMFMTNTSERANGLGLKIENVRQDSEFHRTDPNAHGAGVKREEQKEVDSKKLTWIMIAATVLGGFAGVITTEVHKIFGGGKP